jgi:hypothetical protein
VERPLAARRGKGGGSSARRRQGTETSSYEPFTYWLSPQHLVFARLQIEHIVSIAEGGSSTEEDLALRMRVAVHDAAVAPESALNVGTRSAGFDEVMRESDIISCQHGAGRLAGEHSRGFVIDEAA